MGVSLLYKPFSIIIKLANQNMQENMFLTYSYIIDYQPIDKRFNKKVIFCSKIFPKNVCISKFCCNFAVFLKHNNIVLLFKN